MFVFIIYLVNQKSQWTTCWYCREFKHGNKIYDKILGIGIPDLLMNLMSCHGFLKNKNTFVVLKCPKSMLEYYFPKGFTRFEWNTINLEKLPNKIKQRINA